MLPQTFERASCQFRIPLKVHVPVRKFGMPCCTAVPDRRKAHSEPWFQGQWYRIPPTSQQRTESAASLAASRCLRWRAGSSADSSALKARSDAKLESESVCQTMQGDTNMVIYVRVLHGMLM